MRIAYAESFAADLDEITDYIAADSRARAVSFVEEIRWVCLNVIAKHPRGGRPRPELKANLRSFATHGRTVFYVFDPDQNLLKFYRVIGRQQLSPESFPG